RLDESARLQHEALVLLLATGYAPVNLAVDGLKQAQSAKTAVLAEQQTVLEARRALDEVPRVLPASAPYLERAGRSDAHWLEAATAARDLGDRLATARVLGSLTATLDEVQQHTSTLRRRLEDLRAPFTHEGVARLIRDIKRPSATAGHWREVDA